MAGGVYTGFLRIVRLAGKLVLTLVLMVLFATMVLSLSPIYDFPEPKPFSGPDVFNPYENFNPAIGWKRANFHTHTRVSGPLNECRYWPKEVLEDYTRLGYDILTFSNHNLLTEHPSNPDLQVNVYEHGYNLFKFHKLVFGAESVWHFDHMLPLLASQRQWQIDHLASRADFIQLNHPLRTWFTTKHIMESVGSYRIIELDSGVTVDQLYWDWALSAGHYSFALANDDCHNSKRSSKIGVRCNFLNVESGRYEDLKKCLLSGCYYSMRVPDFGNGDWTKKIEGNRHLPSISSVKVEDDGIEICFCEAAKKIVATGQNHRCLCEVTDSNRVEYLLPKDEPYVRFTAFFPSGEVIYTNVFARFNRADSQTPYTKTEPMLNVPLTIIYNFTVVVVALLLLWSIFLLWKRSFRKDRIKSR